MRWLSVACLCLAFCSALAADYNVSCYGNISELTPKGKRVLRGGGYVWDVATSQRAVRLHQTALNSLKTWSETIAQRNCFPASVIGALASRESNGGDDLDPRGYGDGGRGYGILQCDVESSGLRCRDCPPRSSCHMTMMIEDLLIRYIRQVARKFPSWSRARQLQGGVAAYNFGVSNVRSWANLDTGTTGHDYSNDVIARAQYLRRMGWS